MTNDFESETIKSDKSRRGWILEILLLIILIAGAYLRFVGLDWGEYQYLHPDERFLVWVASDMSTYRCSDTEIPVRSCPEELQVRLGFSDYFNTAISTLNPHNVGHSFYVYGTLPLLMARYGATWLE
jgi:hypothetical protein